MAYFYIGNEDESITLSLDDNAQELAIGGVSRNFDIVDYMGADGGYLKGFGNYSSRKIKISRKEKAEGSDGSAWNSRRTDWMAFFTKPAYEDWYLYILDGEGTSTYRALCYCEETSEDKYTFIRISDMREFSLIIPEGVFTKTTSTTDSLSITSDNEHSMSFTNNGLIECAPTFNYTPTGNEESFAVKISEEFGFLLAGTFIAGSEISYNMATGILTIGGAMVNIANYLVKGSPFKIRSGTTTLYITCSGAGSFDYEFYERTI